MKRIALLSAFAFFATSLYAQKIYMLVGTYTNQGSKGIYTYRFDLGTGQVDSVGVVESSNPSYLAVSRDGKYVYAVNENTDTSRKYLGGEVSAFRFDKQKGELRLINKISSEGKHPCYLSLDKKNRHLIVANYSSGNTSLFSVNKDGGLDSAYQVVTFQGSSINRQRQQSPHLHAAVFDKANDYVYLPDLGADSVHIYRYNKKSGHINPSRIAGVSSTPGHGPRHFVFSHQNNFAYLMEELSGTVQTYKYSSADGLLTKMQIVSTHPDDYRGQIGSADIHISPGGNFLYCSNRGESNSLAIFRINRNDGTLIPAGFQSTLGLTPRNFNIDPKGNFLLVANQKSNDITIFSIDKKTGALTFTGKRIAVPNPVCIKWVR